MPTVKLHGTLRRYFDQHRLDIAGQTVADVLQVLCRTNPAFRTAIYEGHTLRSHLRLIVQRRDIELAAGLDTALADGDELAIFEPISGGR
jgi:molybdopterin synthase sulfur carrier subunit